MFRRIRKPNYSHEETMALLEQIEAHRHILFGKSTNHQRSELWAFIADTVNAVPNSTGRTVEELKHRWKDLSHKTRISLRTFSEAKTNNDQPFVAPSIYFEIIMRILGDGISDRSEFSMLSSQEGQSSSPRFSDDGQSFSASSEIDVKPDINIINKFITGDSKLHNLKMGLNSASPLVGKHQSISNQNPDGSSDISQFTSTSMNFSGPHKRKYISDQSQETSELEDNPIQFQESHLSSTQNGFGMTSVGKSVPWRSNAQISTLRPMRFDPVTQEVAEVDDLAIDSDSSEDEGLCSKLMVSVADERLGTERVNFQENAEKSASILPGQLSKKGRKLDTENISLSSLSVEELRKCYFIKKIKMVDQRTRCFQLLEQKFKCEISLLQQQAVSTSQPSFHRNSHNPQVSSQSKDSKANKDNGNEGTILTEFKPRWRQNDSKNCRQSRTVNNYCNNVNSVNNDGDSNAGDDNICDQEESDDCGSNNEDRPNMKVCNS